MNILRTPEIRKKLAVTLLAGIGALGISGCADSVLGEKRSWELLAESNGFSGPVTKVGEISEQQLILQVNYGACKINLETHNPWHKDYASTYLPADSRLAPVPHATADVLDRLPPEYKLDDCSIQR